MGTVQLIISALTFIVALSVAIYGVYQYQDSNRPDLVIHPVDSERTNSQGDGTYSSPPEPAVIFELTNIGKKPAFDVDVQFTPKWSPYDNRPAKDEGQDDSTRWQGARLHVLMPGESTDIIFQRYTNGYASYDNKDLLMLDRVFKIVYFRKPRVVTVKVKKRKSYHAQQELLASEAMATEKNRLRGGGFAQNLYK